MHTVTLVVKWEESYAVEMGLAPGDLVAVYVYGIVVRPVGQIST